MKLLTWASFLRLLKQKISEKNLGVSSILQHSVISSQVLFTSSVSWLAPVCAILMTPCQQNMWCLPPWELVPIVRCARQRIEICHCGAFKSFRALGRPFDPIRPCKDWSLGSRDPSLQGRMGSKTVTVAWIKALKPCPSWLALERTGQQQTCLEIRGL